MNYKIIPFGNRVLVEPYEEPTDSLLIIPDRAKEQPQIGRILAVSDSAEGSFKIGDIIYFSKYAGSEVKVGKSNLIIINIDDVFAVLKEEISSNDNKDDAIPNCHS